MEYINQSLGPNHGGFHPASLAVLGGKKQLICQAPPAAPKKQKLQLQHDD